MTEFVQKTLQELASVTGATLKGDPACAISGIATLEHAKPGDITFLANQKYRKYLKETRASAIILAPEDVEFCHGHALVTSNPRMALVKIASFLFAAPQRKPGIHPSAVIGAQCKIDPTASVGPNCVLGDNVTVGAGVILEAGVTVGSHSVIGDNSRICARVALYDRVVIGKRVLLHSGVVIGSDGFGFAQEGGKWIKVPHIGGVRVGDDVEIGANTTIDRGFLEDTCIGNNVIIDNLVQIGHNVIIGDQTAIAGCVGIAGSTKIGKRCLIGGSTSIAGHIEICDDVQITATSAVNRGLTTPGCYSSGLPAKSNALWRRNVARFYTLDKMTKRLRTIEKKIGISLQTEDDV